MTVVTQLNSLNSGDYPEQENVFSRLFGTLNPFFQSLTQCLQKGLAFGDNFVGDERQLTFVYNGTPTLPLVFPVSFIGSPKEFRICSAYENGTPIILLAAWAPLGRTISVSQLFRVTATGTSALTVGASYRIIARISP